MNPAPKETNAATITFSVDDNGVLSITAVERATNNQNGMTIAFDKGRLSEADIQRMIREAQLFQAHERKMIERNRASNDLEDYCAMIRKCLNEQNVCVLATDTLPVSQKSFRLADNVPVQFRLL